MEWVKLSKVHNNKGYFLLESEEGFFGPLIRLCIALSSKYVIFLWLLGKGSY